MPLLNSGNVLLPRNERRLIAQIVSLERRVSPAGRETITHPDHGHDDVANAVAGVASLARYGTYDASGLWITGEESPPEDPKETAERRKKLYELLLAGKPIPF